MNELEKKYRYGIFTSPTEAVAVESWPRTQDFSYSAEGYFFDACEEALASGIPFHKDEVIKLKRIIWQNIVVDVLAPLPKRFQDWTPLLLTPYEIGEITEEERCEDDDHKCGKECYECPFNAKKYARLKEAGSPTFDEVIKATHEYLNDKSIVLEPAKEDQEVWRNPSKEMLHNDMWEILISKSHEQAKRIASKYFPASGS